MIDKVKSISVVDYAKMTPNKATELRKSVKSVGGEIKVEKNTLFKIALGGVIKALREINPNLGLALFTAYVVGGKLVL